MDTGGLYRTGTFIAVNDKVNYLDPVAMTLYLEKNIRRIRIRDSRIELDGQPVGREIRTQDISDMTSVVSAYPSVRRLFVPLQRSFVGPRGIIAEGRDMGSVVFPDAHLKFFLTASLEVRAKRRYAEDTANGIDCTLESVTAGLVVRDRRDMTRQDSPLIVPKGAIEIDTSEIGIPELIARMVEECDKFLVAA